MLQMSNLSQTQSCSKIGGSQSIFKKTIDLSGLKRFYRYDANVNRKRVPGRSRAKQDVEAKPNCTATAREKEEVEFLGDSIFLFGTQKEVLKNWQVNC